MKLRDLASGIVLGTAMAAGLAASQATTPSTPSACLEATRTFQKARMKEAGLPMTSEKFQSVQKEKVEFARGCIAKLNVEAIPAADLPALADLYVEAGQAELALSTAAGAVKAAGSDPAARAHALLAATRIVMRQPKSDARNSLAEKYVADLAALPAPFAREKVEGHGLLNAYYRGDDIDAGIIEHSTKIIQLGKQLTPEQRQPLGRTLVAAYVNLAEALAGQERTPEALDVLRRAPSELAGVPDVAATVKPTLDRYLLVGTPGPAITAPRWLNVTPEGGKVEMPGQVTWLQFTAHWCGPCRESYPGVARLHERFGKRGFRVVMSTQLYGRFGNEPNVPAERELALIRDYFPAHGVTFPVAVEDYIPPNYQATTPDWPGANEAKYRVGAIPQIQILDKKGVVRLIMVGYDEANEPRLAGLIERLLGEK
jgi:thiol-disulfide isomerase/thioredoxin